MLRAIIKRNLPPLLALLAFLAFASSFFYYQRENFPSSTKISIEKIAASALKACGDENLNTTRSKETCYSKEFQKIAFNYEHKTAFQALVMLQEFDQEARGCHFIAHGIGYGAYKRKKSYEQLIREIDRMCSYGAVHGVIESYVASLPHGTFSEVLADICPRQQPVGDCNHIIGHLALVEKKGDIGSALQLCELLQDEKQLSHCLTGVFMEHMTALNLITHGYAPETYLDWGSRIEELETLCRSHTEKKGVACWKEIAHVAAVKFQHEPKKIFAFCNTAQIEEASEKCRRHAIGIISAHEKYQFDTLKEMCKIKQLNDPVFEKKCYSFLVSSMMTAIPQKAITGIDFCLALDGTFKEDCMRAIGHSIRSTSLFTNEEKHTLCERAPTAQLLNLCLGNPQ